jgi:cytidylate kinase
MAFVIAVDGPAASGKGTIAAGLAKLYGYPVLDTGLLYRGSACAWLRAAATWTTRRGRRWRRGPWTWPNWRAPRCAPARPARLASRVACIPASARPCSTCSATSPAGAGRVIDGRDIGTVIAPEAPAKLFVTATPEVRADRRWKQLVGQGEA